MTEPTPTNALLILGSARREGDTHKLAAQVFDKSTLNWIDLLDYPLYPYSYTGSYPADDAFERLTHQLLAHQILIFATPVYWYSMSGLMKTMFDRFTDLVTLHKPAGRQLKGKKVYLLAVGSDARLPEGFEVPFRRTAGYLDMEWGESYYRAVSELPTLSEEDRRRLRSWIGRVDTR
ncbi:flavodoxin family protein [Cesiribacter andamanensis]|uniref:Putative NAD(P)H-dependent FMN-containing oxidoreductase ywqN n=1 Tax=Cesiribacter andamanensis AMV16 TaxID=1279009 RepID=M7MXI9_9BACT|nr:NAD(P)H-dependent oxidoreductase [Cesiribacter andamanensis]EMR01163.1 Putative NAD(P)H-dependent FMN-containing oxidoreductase ywqN [Cesiribacter andamanensis AMV16]